MSEQTTSLIRRRGCEDKKSAFILEQSLFKRRRTVSIYLPHLNFDVSRNLLYLFVLDN